ncbi:MAG: tetratricopeptide repeat protein [Eubacterium sp.]|nr:tetratricopeptide repeat protein [Eubacterium sp.]
MSEVQKRKKKRKMSKAKRRRLRQLAVMMTFVTAAVLVLSLIIVINCISDKEDIRDKAIVEYNNGNYEQAIKLFNDSLDEYQWFSRNMDLDTRLYIADSYMELRQYDKARDIYKELREETSFYLDKDYLDTMIPLANALYSFTNEKDYAKALPDLEKAVEAGHDKLNMYIGVCYLELGNSDKMMECFNKYIDKYGLNTFIAYELSAYYLSINDLTSAESYIERGMNCEDDDYKYLLKYNRAVLLEINKDYQSAYDIVSQLRADYPDNEDIEKEYDFLYTRVNIDKEPVNGYEHEPEKSEE